MSTTEDKPKVLTAAEVAEVGEALFGEDWRGELGPKIGVTKSHGYNIAKHGCDRLVAMSLIGLLAREIATIRRDADTLDGLLARLEGRVSP